MAYGEYQPAPFSGYTAADLLPAGWREMRRLSYGLIARLNANIEQAETTIAELLRLNAQDVDTLTREECTATAHELNRLRVQLSNTLSEPMAFGLVTEGFLSGVLKTEDAPRRFHERADTLKRQEIAAQEAEQERQRKQAAEEAEAARVAGLLERQGYIVTRPKRLQEAK